MDFELTHPLASVPTTVYEISEVEFVLTTEPIVVFNPFDGDQT